MEKWESIGDSAIEDYTGLLRIGVFGRVCLAKWACWEGYVAYLVGLEVVDALHVVVLAHHLEAPTL